MILVPCLNCYTVARVIDDAEKTDTLVGPTSDFWPNKYICISCGKSCEGILESEADIVSLSKMKTRDLTADEMYAAQNGLGTPDEMLCDLATVRELLGSNVKVHGQTLQGTTRCLITMLEMPNGVRLYLGASSHGAIIYRIARPVSYTKKALEESTS